MTERDTFLDAIRAEPADDLPRLVYADWLEEHGDDVRAAIIRQQVAHPTSFLFTHRLALVSRSEIWNIALLPNAFPRGATIRLREELPDPREVPYLEALEFRRGFVDAVRLSWNSWCDFQTWMRVEWPITRVHLTTMPVTRYWVQYTHEASESVDGQVIWAKRSEIPADPVQQDLFWLARRWPGLTFSTPASRR